MKHLIDTLILAAAATALLFQACSHRIPDGEYRIELLSTGDVHGAWFDSTYTGGGVRRSLYAVKAVVDSVREAAGEDKVVFLDAGDCLQGDNAPYYYNYIDTLSPHLFPQICAYMGYDAVAVGNHDIETGHKVYDKVAKELADKGIPFLGGNAFRDEGKGTYFTDHVILRKGRLRIAVLGYTNPNMKEWLMENLWSGMHFESLIPLVQKDVDKVRAEEKPDVVIVVCHSGSGNGDGKELENQGLDLFKSLRGVDFVIGAHDHRPYTALADSIAYIDGGSKASNLGHGTLTLVYKRRIAVSRKISCGLIPIDKTKIDTAMSRHFHDDYLKVKTFSTQPVGTLSRDIFTRDAFKGQSPYINFVHYIQLSCKPAQISMAAPLSYDKVLKAGELRYNDLFTIYPYENQLFVIKMSGEEIKNYLEYSYDLWIKTAGKTGEPVLNITKKADERFGADKWSFVNRSYNFDSAAGLDYSVDVTKPKGERISIKSLADGTPFDTKGTYNVALTSYRASGGGGILREGAGVDTDKISERTVAVYPEIRSIVFNYLKENGSLDIEKTSDEKVIGTWNFLPQPYAGERIEKDFKLVFGD